MPRIPDSDIEYIKQSVDLVGLCRSRGIKLKKVGQNYKGCCPFHEEENASFIVTPSKNLWHCFGCGKGGNVIQLVQLLDKISFPEAVAKLSQRSIQKAPGKATKTATKRKISSLDSRHSCAHFSLSRSKLLSLVLDYYHAVFNQQQTGKEYLKQRGLVEPALFSRFKIGFCTGNIRESMPKDDQKIRELKAVGILNENGREFFTNCVVFPIPDHSGQIVNLYGRRVRNGQVNHLYLPGKKSGVFNGVSIQSADSVILVESILDALALIQAGYPGAIPCYGSPGIPEDHLSILKNFTEKAVFLCFDSDDAGRKASGKAKVQLEEIGITSRQIILPEGHDPCSLLLQDGGKDILRRLFRRTGGQPGMGANKKAIPSKITREDGKLRVTFNERMYELQGLNRESTKCKVTVKVFTIDDPDRFHLDTIDLYSSRSRAVFARGVAELFSVRDAQVSAELLALIAPVEKYKEVTNKEPEIQKSKMSEEECTEAVDLLKARDLFERILSDFEAVGYTGEEINKMVGYLATISRKLDDPISICIQSRSAAGKSALQDAILNFVPPEDVVRYTCLTGQALFYKEADSLKHKILAIEEDAGAKNANYSIRTMQSSNFLSIASAGRDPETGKLRTDENIVEGPTTFFLTTTAPEIESETGSRFLFLTLDESDEATARVHEAQRMMNTLEGLVTRKKVEKIIRLHQNAQRLLKTGLKVVIPFAKHLRFRIDSIRARRDHKKYLTLIQSIAFLRQYQREIKTIDVEGESVKYIEANLDDVRLANKLAAEVLGISLDELSPPSRRLLDQIREMVIKKSDEQGINAQDYTFTRRDIREYTGWSDTQVKRHINQLVDLEYIYSIMGSKGKEFMYELQYVEEVESGKKFLSCLIDVDELAKEIEKEKKEEKKNEESEDDDSLGG
jgi:DNA primase